MEGAVSALRQARPAEMPAVVCNEITAVSRSALADGILTMVISTPLAALCRELVDLMAHAIETGAANAPGQTFLPFDIYPARKYLASDFSPQAIARLRDAESESATYRPLMGVVGSGTSRLARIELYARGALFSALRLLHYTPGARISVLTDRPGVFDGYPIEAIELTAKRDD